MVHFCIEKWGGKEIRRYVVWPVFGTFEMWTCQTLYDHVVDQYPQDLEEIEYTGMWKNACSGLYPLRAHRHSTTWAGNGSRWRTFHLPIWSLCPSLHKRRCLQCPHHFQKCCSHRDRLRHLHSHRDRLRRLSSHVSRLRHLHSHVSSPSPHHLSNQKRSESSP